MTRANVAFVFFRPFSFCSPVDRPPMICTHTVNVDAMETGAEFSSSQKDLHLLCISHDTGQCGFLFFASIQLLLASGPTTYHN